MNSNLERAKTILNQGGYSCVMCSDSDTLYAEKRGVAPLLEWLDSGMDLSAFSAADKVVGKAAAMLYILMNVKQVYAQVISDGAVEAFKKYKVIYFCDTSVNKIRNRDNTGFCPMEEAVRNISNPIEAKAAIEEKLKQLQKGN